MDEFEEMYEALAEGSSQGREHMEPFYSAMLMHGSSMPGVKVQLSVVNEFLADEHKRYDEAYGRLLAILETGIYAYVRRTMVAIQEAMEDDARQIVEGEIDSTQPGDSVNLAMRMRSAVLSFCSALHMHQEHNNLEAIDRYGDGSKVHNKIRRAFNRLYERSPEYRILWHLRNTMVHHALDVVSINATGFIDGNATPQAISYPRVNLQAIAELNPKISEAMKKELLGRRHDPLVLELVGKAMPLVQETNRRVVKLLNPDLDEVCATVREFDSLFGGRDGVRCLTSEHSTNEPPPLRISYSTWSGDVVMFARERRYESW